MEDGKREGRLGDEDITWHWLEGRAGRIWPALEIARYDDALALVFQHYLRRAEDVAGRNQAHLDLAGPHAFAVSQGLLLGADHILETRPHDGECLGGGQRMAVARPGVVAMAMGDDRPRYGDRRIDVKVAGYAIESARCRMKPGAGI